MLVYVRWSSDSQERGSTEERQLRIIGEFCQRTGRTLDPKHIIYDRGKSASKAEHITKGEFGRLLKRIEADELRGEDLIIENIDRLSRQKTLVAANVFSSILLHGVTVITADDGQVYTEDSPAVQFALSTMHHGRAHDYTATLSKNVRGGWKKVREAVASGTRKIVTSNIPPWLTVEGEGKARRFALVRDKAEVVRRVFREYLSGLSIRRIAQGLNTDRIPLLSDKKGVLWSGSHVGLLLRNERAAGYYQPKRLDDATGRYLADGDPIENFYVPARTGKPLVSPADFAAAQSLLRERGVGGSSHRGVVQNIFGKLARCAKCGGITTTKRVWRTYADGSGMDWRYLRCLKSLNTIRACDKTSWNYAHAEKILLIAIRDYVQLSDLTGSDGRQDEVKRMRKQIAATEAELERLAAMEDTLTDELVEFRTEAQKDIVRRKIVRLAEKREGLSEDLPGQRRRLAELESRASNAESKLKSVGELISLLYSRGDENSRSDVRQGLRVELREIIGRVELHLRDGYCVLTMANTGLRMVVLGLDGKVRTQGLDVTTPGAAELIGDNIAVFREQDWIKDRHLFDPSRIVALARK